MLCLSSDPSHGLLTDWNAGLEVKGKTLSSYWTYLVLNGLPPDGHLKPDSVSLAIAHSPFHLEATFHGIYIIRLLFLYYMIVTLYYVIVFFNIKNPLNITFKTLDFPALTQIVTLPVPFFQ